MVEIRWHGRGGQGAKTAALLLADIAFEAGLYVQGFPEYGPERMGAPITAYNRLDDEPIRIHSNIYEPDMVVIVDETLVSAVDVTKGLKPGGNIIVNTKRDPALVAARFEEVDAEVYAVDAADISLRALGKNLPNTPLLSVVSKLTGIIGETKFYEAMETAFSEKFRDNPTIVQGNMNAVREAWNGAVHVNESRTVDKDRV